MVDHAAVIRNRLNAMDNELGTLRTDNRALRKAGKLLIWYLRQLRDDKKPSPDAITEIAAAINLFENR